MSDEHRMRRLIIAIAALIASNGCSNPTEEAVMTANEMCANHNGIKQIGGTNHFGRFLVMYVVCSDGSYYELR